MSNRVDVIGIGAINFDFIFFSNKSDLKSQQNFDDGEEIFIKGHVFKDNLLKLQQHSELIQTQVGGSALLAIRTLKICVPNYVRLTWEPMDIYRNTLKEKICHKPRKS